MKYFFSLLFLFVMIASCKPKVLAGKDLDKKLIETMGDYLDKTLQPGVTATVKSVSYFPQVAKKNYLCHFNVDMHFQNKDTSGLVIATISNDFTTVSRTQ